MTEFNAEKVKDEIIIWIREWFEKNGKGCNAIVGMSGGKDSSVVAALCVEALGKGRVIGVLMPKGDQDLHMGLYVCGLLGIQPYEINIESAFNGIIEYDSKFSPPIKPTQQALTNLPARLRMSTLYYVSQCLNGRVANTCNLSEDWVGYSTRYGDSVGDFSPLSNLTVKEVKAIGEACQLPSRIVNITPEDGLSGKTDEENFGFTYDELDAYIRNDNQNGFVKSGTIKKIDELHKKNKFKLELMDCFEYEPK